MDYDQELRDRDYPLWVVKINSIKMIIEQGFDPTEFDKQVLKTKNKGSFYRLRKDRDKNDIPCYDKKKDDDKSFSRCNTSYKRDGHILTICFVGPSDKPVTKAQFDPVLKTISGENKRTGNLRSYILVSEYGANSSLKTTFNEIICPEIKITEILLSHLLVDIMKHQLQSSFAVLDNTKRNEVIRESGLSAKNFPKILSSDPVVIRLGAKKGDILRIFRNHEYDGPRPLIDGEVIYRIVM